MQKGLQGIVQYERNINFYLDHWLPLGPIRSLIQGPLLPQEYDYKVATIINANQQWDLTPLSVVLPREITQFIYAQPLPIYSTHPSTTFTDTLTWNHNSSTC